MKKNSSRFLVAIAMLLAFSVFFSSPVIAEPTNTVTIVGEVNDQYQIVAKDGTIYEIADTETGDQVLQFVGSVLEITGEVIEEDGIKFIDVKSFKAVEE